MKIRKRKPLRIDDSYTAVSILFNVSNSYVRKIIADTKHQRYVGEKPNRIRRAYLAYKYGKEELVKKIKNDLNSAA